MSNPTRRVTLYVNLPPGWHDRPPEEWHFSAGTRPNEYQIPSELTVAIEVDLPHVELKYPADCTVQGKFVPLKPVAQIQQSR